jgi:transcriptional regulator with XRE-family HTH domain
MGLSQKEAARELDVDASTLARWERGEGEPTGTFATRASRFVKAAQSEQTEMQILPTLKATLSAVHTAPLWS